MTVLPTRLRDHEKAVTLVMQWLGDRHRKGWRNAFESLLDDWRPGEEPGDWPLDDDAMGMVSINAGEWLLARGSINARGSLLPINEYVLSRDGPNLTPVQARWIAQLNERPLRLYRVSDVRVGQGLTLVDEMDAGAEPIVVREISGSRSARPGMLLGARVMQVGDAGQPDEFVLSGAMYPFSQLAAPAALEDVRAAAGGAEALHLHEHNRRDLAEMAIARVWLAQWFEPVRLPELRDASTGEPMLLVTDHYRVLDAQALAAALSAQPDVSGNAEASWHRDSDAGDGLTRSLVAINPGKSADRIEVFYRTQRLADEGRVWFEGVAAAAVSHLTREIVSPAAAMAKRRAAGSGGRSSDQVPPELAAGVIEQVLRKHYANWCNEPIPALNDQTPRQAMATASGLERVKGLLRMYEDGEQRQSTEQKRPAFSFQFLWDELGLER